MPTSESTKRQRVVDLLVNPETAALSNRQIAAMAGCDEGTVRRSRQPTVPELQARIEVLEAELARYRRSAPTPRRVRSDNRPLWEVLTASGPKSTVPMIGD